MEKLYKIICRNKEKTLAYVEPVTNVCAVPASIACSLFSEDPVYYTDSKNRIWTCSRSDIIVDPQIVSCFIENRCYKIAL